MISGIYNNPYLLVGQHIRTNQFNLNQSLVRLTSGNRVNSPSEDPGSYFIAQSLSIRADATKVVARGLADHIEALRSTEDVLLEIRGLVKQQIELVKDAVAEADPVVREVYAVEYDEIKSQIDTLVNTSRFNGMNMIDGDQTFTIQVDEDVTNTITYTTLDTTFDAASGLNLGLVVDDYSLAAGDFNGGDAADFQSALEASRLGDNLSASGLTNIDRNISRVANTRQLLEGRESYLLNKATNYESAVSAIAGIDTAEEATRFSSLQIKQQAGLSVLAQANNNAGSVTSILLGYVR